jgi:tetratricopeptide (TPR) repeat protein
MNRKFALFILFLFISSLVSGCNLMPSPDDTIAAPRLKPNLSVSNDDINTIITGFMQPSTKLLIPRKNSDPNPYYFLDIDGDRNEEIIFLFKDEKQLIKSGFMILRKGYKTWQKAFEVTDDIRSIQAINFKDITGDNLPELFIEIDNQLEIYHYSNFKNKLESIISIPFTEYKVNDFSGIDGTDGIEELLVYNKTIQEPKVSVYRWNGFIFENVMNEFPEFKTELINFVQEMMKDNPDKSSFWYNLSCLQQDINSYDEALTSINRAIYLESNPNTIQDYKLSKARLLIKTGMYNEARRLVNESIPEYYNNKSECSRVEAESYLAEKKYNTAKEIYRSISIFPYDENLQKIDALLAQRKIFNYIEDLGQFRTDEISKNIASYGAQNDIVINCTLPLPLSGGVPKVLLVDYHIKPANTFGKENVGGHVIYWWKNNILYCKEYSTVWPVADHNLVAGLVSTGSSIYYDGASILKLEVTYENEGKDDDYPYRVKNIFQFINDTWKFVLK